MATCSAVGKPFGFQNGYGGNSSAGCWGNSLRVPSSSCVSVRQFLGPAGYAVVPPCNDISPERMQAIQRVRDIAENWLDELNGYATTYPVLAVSPQPILACSGASMRSGIEDRLRKNTLFRTQWRADPGLLDSSSLLFFLCDWTRVAAAFQVAACSLNQQHLLLLQRMGAINQALYGLSVRYADRAPSPDEVRDVLQRNNVLGVLGADWVRQFNALAP